MKPGRNDPCPCRSGRKYKNCCGQLAGAVQALPSAELTQLEALMQAGRYPELERTAREQLVQRPESGILWKLLGVSLALQDKAPLEAMANAARWLPHDAEAHSNLGHALRAVGRLDEAIASYRRALEISPELPKLNAIVANTLSHLGRFADAVTSYRRALVLEPSLAETHSNLGNALLNLGQPGEAEACCRRALDLEPQFAGAHTNLGNALREQRKYAAAAASHRRALEIRPDFAEAHINLGNVSRDRGQLDDALAAYQRALVIEPRLAVGHNNLGSALRDLGRIDAAEAAFRQALALQPNYAQAHTNLAIVLRVQSRFAEAESNCRKALELDPRFVPALVFMGELEADKGEFFQAEQSFERAIALDANSAQAWAGICGLRKMTVSDAGWLAGARRVVEQPLAPQAEAPLQYAIGKYFDDVQDYTSAFTYYRQANELAQRYLPRHDRMQLTQAVNQTIHRYDRQWLRKTRCDAITSARPIFVVGMPRSGTTLAEQILASHPGVFGAGELPFWTQAAAKFETTTAECESQRVCTLAEDYLRLLQTLSADALRTVDKMPTHFRSLGLICAALPNARIIHMRRNPIDTCLSIYFQNFDVAHTYGTDLEDLAHYYTEYVRLMKHWSTTVPTGAILDVPYEALVGDPETWSRKMVEFAGLPWDSRCLDFHQARHTVSTRSRWQVRQKISPSSVERWRNYEQFIGPLLTLN